MSPKHLDLYAWEFEGRYNQCNPDTTDQVRGMVRGTEGKRLSYANLKTGELAYPRR